LLHLHPQKYIGAESGVASPKAFIYRCPYLPSLEDSKNLFNNGRDLTND